ncbi:hypothetical protein GP475_10355 [Corynebacterium poyangense]|uniref:Uncharacterized protein n=1 Tax=Corynebacterium poyangense TaxID=2684405 RepID=A0A7H0SR13_9CORY|nr:hypothetical protein [Corynebacterium poyangense]MBZ8176408.1 hypothetical protein [Corynebacterium poyangense]QNQ90988.1 hypothetical protein GP475_10355 [Corynebacterium poyangense]
MSIDLACSACHAEEFGAWFISSQRMTKPMDHGAAQPGFLIKETLPAYLNEGLTTPDGQKCTEIRTSLIDRKWLW